MSPKNTTQKVACNFRTMVKLFLRIHLGCSEECQILINSTTQQLKAFRETGKTFLLTSFPPFPSHSSLFYLLAQKVFKHLLSLTPIHHWLHIKKKLAEKDKYTYAHKQWWDLTSCFTILIAKWYHTKKVWDKLIAVSVSRTKGFDSVFCVYMC